MRPTRAEPDTPAGFTALYCDAAILVVDKPAGLPVHPSSRYVHGTLVGRLRERYGEGFAAPVHRLDRETSGLVLCARTSAAARALGKAFLRGAVQKEYLAIACGAPASDELWVDAPIAVGGALVRIAVRIDRSHGQPARTRFVVEERLARDGELFTLLRAFPMTGRQHQIRVHLRAAGLPLLGDKIYGHDEACYDRFTRFALTADDRARLRLPRQALHAARLSFVHPLTGAEVCFVAPLPADLSAFIAATRQDPAA